MGFKSKKKNRLIRAGVNPKLASRMAKFGSINLIPEYQPILRRTCYLLRKNITHMRAYNINELSRIYSLPLSGIVFCIKRVQK